MLADGPQGWVAAAGVLKGLDAGLLKVAGTVLFEQSTQAHEAAESFCSAFSGSSLCPAGGGRADGFHAALPVSHRALQGACVVQPTHSPHAAVAPGFHSGVAGDLFHLLVENPHLPAI